MGEDSIVDATRPNAGRIYDYMLGGHHNFEVDRQAADQIIQFLPTLPKTMRLQRWALQDLASELTGPRGFDVIVDFASGMPTNDHMHTVVPEGTTVIYSDRDPVVVEYAHEILAGVPNVYFFLADASRPEELLNRPEVQEILGGRRDLALVHWGIPMFLDDDQLSYAASALHDWAGPNSCWAFNAQGADAQPDPAVLQMYAQMGAAIKIRSLEQYQQLVTPWQAANSGWVSLMDWHGMGSHQISQDDRQAYAGYGAYLVK
jgi:hypothetical protein